MVSYSENEAGTETKFKKDKHASKGAESRGLEARHYHPLRLVEGELGLEPFSQLRATSAASSRALLRCLPSYQNLAWRTDPWTVTLLDHAVRPPTQGAVALVDARSSLVPCAECVCSWGRRAGSPRLSETIWKAGAGIWHSRHASVQLSAWPCLIDVGLLVVSSSAILPSSRSCQVLVSREAEGMLVATVRVV